jgi:hypothetical protein
MNDVTVRRAQRGAWHLGRLHANGKLEPQTTPRVAKLEKGI